LERERQRTLAIMRAQAEARAAALMREAEKNAARAEARLAVADQLRSEGEITTAAQIYVRLAVNKRSKEHADAARKRVAELKEEAQHELEQVDTQLAGLANSGSDADRAQQIRDAFELYDQVVRRYGRLPGAGAKVRHHVAVQRAKPQYAAVLNEPIAKKFWDAAQEHESKEQLCCAFILYEKSQPLLPAPSAKQSRKRLAELVKDPANIEAAQKCRDLRWCHETYARADRVVKLQPSRAKELFHKVLERSPHDSEIHVATAKKLKELD